MIPASPLCRRARGRAGYRKRREHTACTHIDWSPSQVFCTVSKDQPIQGAVRRPAEHLCEHSSSCLDLLRTRHFPHATRVRARDADDPAGSQRVACSGPLCCRHMYCANGWPGQPETASRDVMVTRAGRPRVRRRSDGRRRMPQIALARTTCAGGLTHHHNAGGREGITWKHPEAPQIGLTRLGGKARARSTSVQLTPFTSCRDLEASADTRIQDRFGQAQTVFVCNDCTAIVIAILEMPSPWPWPPRPAAVHLEVVSAMSRSGRGKLLENKENKGIGGAAECAVRAVQDASAGRIRPSWRHTCRRCFGHT